MKQIRFGKTELKVSELAFGGIPIMRLSKTDAVQVIRRTIELGVNFLDTAHGYGDSEEKIGEAIKDIPREKLIIATKAEIPNEYASQEVRSACSRGNALGSGVAIQFSGNAAATGQAYGSRP